MRLAVLSFTCALLLGACGGGANSTAPGPVGNAPDQPPDTNQPADPPKSDDPPPNPNAWRELKTAPPQGWHKLASKDTMDLMSRIKTPPRSFQYAGGITSLKPPGSTDGDAAWLGWAEQTVACLLYRFDEREMIPEDALDAHRTSLVDGESTTEIADGVATAHYTASRVSLSTFHNRHGSYLCVTLLPEQVEDAQKQAVAQWLVALSRE